MPGRKKGKIETDINDDRTSVVEKVAAEDDIDLERISYTKEEIQKLLGYDILANQEKKIKVGDSDTIVGDIPTDIPSVKEVVDKKTGFNEDAESVRSHKTHRSHKTESSKKSSKKSHKSEKDLYEKDREARKRRRKDRERDFYDKDEEKEKKEKEKEKEDKESPFKYSYDAETEEGDKKKDYMKRKMLDRLNHYKDQGMKIREVGVGSSYDEIADEVNRIGEKFKLKSAIELQRQGLIQFAKTIELVMGLVEPIDFVLEGWGDIIEEEVTTGSFDPIFVEIYDKHGHKLPQSPEARLILSVGLSALKVASMNFGGKMQENLFKSKIAEKKKGRKSKANKNFTMEMPEVSVEDLEKQYGEGVDKATEEDDSRWS